MIFTNFSVLLGVLDIAVPKLLIKVRLETYSQLDASSL